MAKRIARREVNSTIEALIKVGRECFIVNIDEFTTVNAAIDEQ